MQPKRDGGTNRTSNLVPSCVSCNNKKGRRDIVAFRDWVPGQVVSGLASALNQLLWAEDMWADKDAAQSVLILVQEALAQANHLEVSFWMDRVVED